MMQLPYDRLMFLSVIVTCRPYPVTFSLCNLCHVNDGSHFMMWRFLVGLGKRLYSPSVPTEFCLIDGYHMTQNKMTFCFADC